MPRIQTNEPTVFGHPNFYEYSPPQVVETEPKNIHEQIEEAAQALKEIDPVVKQKQNRTPYVLLGVAFAAIAALAYQNYTLSQQIPAPSPATPSFTPACKSISECWKFDKIECQNLLHQLFSTSKESELSKAIDSNLDTFYSYLARVPDQINVTDSINFVSGTSILDALIQMGCSNTVVHIDFAQFTDKQIMHALLSANRARNEQLFEKLSQIVIARGIKMDQSVIDQMIHENLDFNDPSKPMSIALQNYVGRTVHQFDAKTTLERNSMARSLVRQDWYKLAVNSELTNIANEISLGSDLKDTVYTTLEHHYRLTPDILRKFLNENPEQRKAFEIYAANDVRIQMNKYCPIENIEFKKV